MAKASAGTFPLNLQTMLCAVSLSLMPLATPARAEEPGDLASVSGTLTLTDAAGKTFPASGVRLALDCESEPFTRVRISDERGAFRFADVAAGSCTIVTDLQGFRPAHASFRAGDSDDLELSLEVEPIFAGLSNPIPDARGPGAWRHRWLRSGW